MTKHVLDMHGGLAAKLWCSTCWRMPQCWLMRCHLSAAQGFGCKAQDLTASPQSVHQEFLARKKGVLPLTP
jgi:hypothetical protein